MLHTQCEPEAGNAAASISRLTKVSSRGDIEGQGEALPHFVTVVEDVSGKSLLQLREEWFPSELTGPWKKLRRFPTL